MSRSKTPSTDEQNPGVRDAEETVLSRWSRRKRETRLDDDPLQVDTVEELSEEPVSRDTALEDSEVEDTPTILTDEDMPDVETLTPDSDFRPFMSKGVSHALRRKALRKLFAAPFFNIRDGLDDYDDDFRSFAPLGDVVTADMKYEKKHKEKLRLEKEAEEQERLALEESERAADDGQIAADTEAEADIKKEPDAVADDESGEPASIEESSDASADSEPVDAADTVESQRRESSAAPPARVAMVRGSSVDDEIDEDV